MSGKAEEMIAFTGFIEIQRESPQYPLRTMVNLLWDMELPYPVYEQNRQGERNRVGEVIFVELLENEQGVHVLRGAFVEDKPDTINNNNNPIINYETP